MKKYIFTCLLIGLGFLGMSTSVRAATLSISPSQMSIDPTQTFTADILLDTGGEDIDGVDIFSLNYDETLLEVQDSMSSASGIQIAPGSILPVTLVNNVNGTNGTIQFSQINAGGNTFRGVGTLATITFKALASGTSAITIDFSPAGGNDSNVAGGGAEKLTSVNNASYKVNTPPSPSSSGGGGGGSKKSSSGGSGGGSTSPTTTTSTTTIGCTGTTLFSTVNGKPCASVSATTTIGCLPGGLFSVINGQRCAIVTIPTITYPVYTTPVSVTSSSYVITKTLFIGMRDSQVTTLQNMLLKLGYNIGTPTGYFGVLTDAAIKNFQRTRGIASGGTLSTTGYGLVGPKTRNALLSAVSGL